MRKIVQIREALEKEFPEVSFSDTSIAHFCTYMETLEQWNKRINLTAVRRPDEMIIKHLLDSLAILNTSVGKLLMSPTSYSLLDLGSGAGLPSIPLQIANPLLKVYSVDKSEKKIGFQEFVKAKLILTNLTLIAERVEHLMEAGFLRNSIDFMVSRAFDQIEGILKYASFFLKDSGTLIIWKGEGWRKEFEAVQQQTGNLFELQEVSPYRLSASRFGGTILVFKRSITN